jgi:hypothetical protein
MKSRTILIAVAATLALSACSSSTPPPAPVTVTATATTTTTLTAPATSKAGTSVASLDAVRASLVKAGMPCDGWTVSSALSGSCTDVVIVTFMPQSPTDTQRSFFMAAFALSWSAVQASQQPVALLVGDNWMVRMHKDDAAIIQKTMGGIVLTRP